MGGEKMYFINCTENCRYQSEGKCTLECTENAKISGEIPCAYFQEKKNEEKAT
jgi:hypothetical protein